MDNRDQLSSILATRRFIQIPGPNPIVARGGPGAWDEGYIEGGDIFKDYSEGRETYYLYYHGAPLDAEKWGRRGYRIGLATAAHPLGPFVKVPQNPILDLGPAGSWDDRSVACPSILKEGTDNYYMWYSGAGTTRPERGVWSVGLATAPHPLGPWTKYEGNPIIDDFGYVGGVVRAHGKYFMYNEYPIDSTGRDYGPLAVATADNPYGPWKRWEGNPVLAPEGWGSWDDGGYSEAKVIYHDGVFHCFYGGTKLHPDRRRSLESIGYAFSTDGYHFTRHVDNPVASRTQNPDASAFAEVKGLFEPPFFYLYHTLRYLSLPVGPEDLGVQVLATTTPFRLTMPVLQVPDLAPGATTGLSECPPINLAHISSLALTTRCRYLDRARAGIRIHVRASSDGLEYDSADWQAIEQQFVPGDQVSQTIPISAQPAFVKVLIENLDQNHRVTDLSVWMTLSG